MPHVPGLPTTVTAATETLCGAIANDTGDSNCTNEAEQQQQPQPHTSVVVGFRGKDEGEAVTVEEVRGWEAEHGEIGEGAIVLLDFGWAERWTTEHGVEDQPYHGDNPGLSEEAAGYLADRGVKLVGGDVPTVDVGSDPVEPAHRVLLPRGVLVLENAANLGELPPRGAFFVGLPLRVRDGTGCPVRAVAFVPEG